jgi:transcriptional regulator with XRE-family HTH domain
MTAAQRAVARIRQEMTERRISQRDLASILKCSQGRIAKLLNGGVHLRINDVERMAKAVGIDVTEAVRDHGLQFLAEMTPSELRLLHRLRQRPLQMHGLLQFLEIQDDVRPPGPSKPKRGRPLQAADRGKKSG